MRIKQSGKIDPVEIEAAMPYQDDAPTPEEGDEFLALNFCSPGCSEKLHLQSYLEML